MVKEKTQLKIIQRAKQIRSLLIPEGTDEAKSCFYHAIAMQRAILEVSTRMRPVLQAGSASWKVVADELDDGVSPTQFSYRYSGWKDVLSNDLSILPEIHCWVVALSPDYDGWNSHYEGVYVIDSCVKYLPELAEGYGIKWTAPKPPECLWTTPRELPDGWLYEADKEACENIFSLSKGIDLSFLDFFC